MSLLEFWIRGGPKPSAFGDLAIPRMSIAPEYRGLVQHFEHVALHYTAIQTFSSGYGFMLASNDVAFHDAAAETLAERANALSGEIRAITPRAFPGCLTIPPYLREALHRNAPPPSAELGDVFSWRE